MVGVDVGVVVGGVEGDGDGTVDGEELGAVVGSMLRGAVGLVGDIVGAPVARIFTHVKSVSCASLVWLQEIVQLPTMLSYKRS